MGSVVSIVIPVYNENKTLAEVVERIDRVDISPYAKEIIMCDDGSTDGTSGVIASLANRHAGLRAYTSPVNFGKGAAVRIGMSLATGDLILIQDADLELDPADYPALLAPFSDPKTMIVYGSRFLSTSGDVPRARRLANQCLTSLTNILFGAHLTDMETAYKVFRRELLGNMSLRCVRFDFEPEITAHFLRARHRILEVPVAYRPRTAGEGKKMAWRDGFDAVYTLLRCRFLS